MCASLASVITSLSMVNVAPLLLTVMSPLSPSVSAPLAVHVSVPAPSVESWKPLVPSALGKVRLCGKVTVLVAATTSVPLALVGVVPVSFWLGAIWQSSGAVAMSFALSVIWIAA